MAHLKSVAKGFILMLIGLVFTKAVSMLFKIVFSRYYGAHNLGLYSLGLGIFTLLTTFSIFGFNYGLSRYISLYHEKDKDKLKNIMLIFFSIAVFLSIFFALGLFFSSDYLAKLYKTEELSLVFKLFAISIPLYVISLMIQKIFEGFKEFKNSALLESGINLLKFLFLIVCVFLSLKLPFVILATALSFLLMNFLGIHLIKKHIHIKDVFKTRIDPNLLKDVFLFSWPLALTFILHTILTQFDSLILGYFLTPFDVGIYSLVMSAAGFIGLSALVAGPVLLPSFGELFAKDDKENLKSIYISSFKWLTILAVPVLFLFVSSPVIVMNLFGGKEFISGAPILILLSIAFLISNVVIPTTTILIAVGKTKYLLINTSTTAALSVVMNFILIPRYGIFGAAVTFLVTSIFINVLRIIEVRKILGLNPFDLTYLRMIFIFLLTGVVSFYLPKYIFVNQYFLLVGSFVLFSVISFGLMLILKCFNEEDTEIFNAIKKKILKFKG